jgi:hypothetical protein
MKLRLSTPQPAQTLRAATRSFQANIASPQGVRQWGEAMVLAQLSRIYPASRMKYSEGVEKFCAYESRPSGWWNGAAAAEQGARNVATEGPLATVEL